MKTLHFCVLYLLPSLANAVSVTVTTSPSGLNVKVDGVTAAAPQVFNWVQGTQHQVAVPNPQGNAADRYLFQSWSNGAPLVQTYTTPASTDTLTANLQFQHRVTVTASPAGSGNVIGTGWWPDGFPVTVAASPNAGWVFSSLTGGVSSIYPWAKQTLTMALNVTANFSPRVPNTRQVWVTPTGTAGSGTGTQADPFQSPDAHTFDRLMLNQPDDSQINLLPGVFLTYGSLNGNCQGQGEPGWKVGNRWWLKGSGRDVTTVRLVAICQESTDPQFNGNLVKVIESPYYQDSSDSIVSDLTVDGNYQAFGTHIFDWKVNIGGVGLNGSRCIIRNVKAINTYGWFVDPRAPGTHNLAEDFIFVIANPVNPSNNFMTLGYGNLIENSEVSASGGGYTDGMNIFSGDGRQPLSMTDETLSGLPGGIIRNNIVRDFFGISAYGYEGRGIVVDHNTCINCNNGIRGDSIWMLDVSITNNQFLQTFGGGIILSGDLNARFRRVVIANNLLQAYNFSPPANTGSSPWMVFFKQSNSNPVENLLVYNNRFTYLDSGNGLVPSAVVLAGTTPGVQNVQMINNQLDPIFLQRGQNCPTLDEPLCQTGINGSPTYTGSGNVTFTGVPLNKLNVTIP